VRANRQHRVDSSIDGSSFAIADALYQITKDWPGFRLQYRYHTLYRIAVENPGHCSCGVTLVEVDGVAVVDKMVTLRDDARPHEVRVVLGTESPV
jgi:hypothetical protein